MNTRTTLFTLTIGSIICLMAFPVLAKDFRHNNSQPAFQIARSDGGLFSRTKDAYDREEREQNRQDRKNRADNPRRDEGRRNEGRRDRDENRGRNDDRDRPAGKRNAYRPDEKHHEKPAWRRDGGRYDRPSSGLFKRVARKVKPVSRVKRPRHRISHYNKKYRKYQYIRGPWYYTRYISPFPRHYYPIGFRINVLPRPYVRFVIGGFPYFYYSGIYYQSYGGSYVVVSAPIGAFVSTLPEGFIAFSIGLDTYYYVNDTYYDWDDHRGGYVVVRKPAGADAAIDKATSERLVVYPNGDQSEEQQAKDRYECHRWAVTESGFDPTLEEEEYAPEDNDVYRRAIAACLEGRNYTVK